MITIFPCPRGEDFALPKHQRCRQELPLLPNSYSVTRDRDRINKNDIESTKKISIHMQWKKFPNCGQMRCIITGVLKVHIQLTWEAKLDGIMSF